MSAPRQFGAWINVMFQVGISSALFEIEAEMSHKTLYNFQRTFIIAPWNNVAYRLEAGPELAILLPKKRCTYI